MHKNFKIKDEWLRLISLAHQLFGILRFVQVWIRYQSRHFVLSFAEIRGQQFICVSVLKKYWFEEIENDGKNWPAISPNILYVLVLWKILPKNYLVIWYSSCQYDVQSYLSIEEIIYILYSFSITMTKFIFLQSPLFLVFSLTDFFLIFNMVNWKNLNDI